MRIVATDAFVRREPDDFLRINEDSEDVIRAERAAGAFKGEMLDRLSVLKMKSAAAIGADPNIVVRTARDGGDWTRGAARLVRLQRFAFIKQSALFRARLHAHPQMS